MFEGMDIPWVSKLNPKNQDTVHTANTLEDPQDDITKFGTAAFELVKRILARALAPFPEAARSVGAHLRANARVLFNYGLPQKPIDFDVLIIDPEDAPELYSRQKPIPEPAAV